MKINNKIMKAAFAVLTVLSAVLAFFRFNMLNGNKAIDELGLYTDKASGNLFGAWVFILIAITVAFAFFTTKSNITVKRTGMLHSVSSALCMILFMTTGIACAHELLRAPAYVISAYGQVAAKKFDVLLAIETVFIFASVAYFLVEALKITKKQQQDQDKYSVLALIPVLYLAVRAIRLFMDIETQINSSARSFTLLFLVVTMMFFMCEAEYSIPLGSLEKTEEAVAKRAAKYIGFGFVAVQLAVVFVIAPMFTATKGMSGILFSLSDIVIALFVAIRVFSVKADN